MNRFVIFTCNGFSSIGSPITLNILPRTSFPTGALIESPESVTGVFLAKPFVDSIAKSEAKRS